MLRFLTVIIATHASMVFSVSSNASHDAPSLVNGMLPYRSTCNKQINPTASVMDLVPVIVGAKLLDQ